MIKSTDNEDEGTFFTALVRISALNATMPTATNPAA
jgi:hypothetical protein